MSIIKFFCNNLISLHANTFFYLCADSILYAFHCLNFTREENVNVMIHEIFSPMLSSVSRLFLLWKNIGWCYRASIYCASTTKAYQNIGKYQKCSILWFEPLLRSLLSVVYTLHTSFHLLFAKCLVFFPFTHSHNRIRWNTTFQKFVGLFLYSCGLVNLNFVLYNATSNHSFIWTFSQTSTWIKKLFKKYSC